MNLNDNIQKEELLTTIVNILSKKMKKSFLLYSLALILNKEKNVRTKTVESLETTHDFLHRVFKKSSLLLPIFSKILLSIANYFSKQKIHIFFIFFSYSFLESIKHKKSLDNPEATAKMLRRLKLNSTK